ncbi:MAG TPA: pilus assembly protein PilM [Candidatus Binatia bacterium]|jgi:type IV pilus assembly protein PilM|nr:pilus assembly protein PilM [Candidatus Binatia bacterium]
MALLNPLSNTFGLDIGDRTFKLVQVRRGRGKRPYKLIAWNSVDVPEGVMERGDIKDMDKAVEHIARLVRTAKGSLRGRACVACLPEAKTFIKIIEIPAGSSEADLRRAVIREIEQNIPLPPEDIYYDWQVLEEREAVPREEAAAPEPETPAVPVPSAAQKPPMKVLMGAAPKNLVDDYTTMLERAGLAPVALEIEAMAISRAIVPEDEEIDEALGILDIGATRSSLVIYDAGALQMSISIPISGIAITKLVSESLSVSFDDAELLKRECGLDATRCEDKMWKILLPLIDDMTEKIRNALRFYKIGFPQGKKIERLYLCGGGAQFREIDTVLSRKLTIKARRGDAVANLDQHLPREFPRREDALGYATAIGLAMRAADENAKYRNALF